MADIWDSISSGWDDLTEWGSDLLSGDWSSDTSFNPADWADDEDAMSWMLEAGDITQDQFDEAFELIAMDMDPADAFDSGDSFLDTVSGYASDVTDFFTEDVNWGKVAGNVAKSLYGQDKRPSFQGVKGTRLNAPSGSSTAGSFKASPIDLGYTGKVQSALRSLTTAQGVGASSIDATLALLRARAASGPLITIPQSTINVKSRAKKDA